MEDNGITEAIAATWDGVLGQLTNAGATREEIADMALECASAIANRTFTALWPDGGEVPTIEREYAVPLAHVAAELARARSLRERVRTAVPDVPDVTGPGEGA